MNLHQRNYRRAVLFLGVLSATGYAEIGKLPLGTYVALALFLLVALDLCTQGITSMKKPLTGGQSQSTAKTNITLT